MLREWGTGRLCGYLHSLDDLMRNFPGTRAWVTVQGNPAGPKASESLTNPLKVKAGVPVSEWQPLPV